MPEFEEENQLQVYQPEGAVGLRYRKQLFNNKDLGYIGFSSHVLESLFRKKYHHSVFDQDPENPFPSYEDYMVSEVCPLSIFSNDIYHQTHSCSEDPPLYSYLSTNYYKSKSDYIQNPFKNETFLLGGIQIQTADSQGNEFPRDNSYLNYALGVKNSYELPLIPLDEIEVEQIIESFIYKKAKTHNRENFFKFMEVYGAERVQNMESFQKITFTYADPEHISNLTQGLKPNKISSLVPNNQLFKFFHGELEVSPSHIISFDECYSLIPKRHILTIDNLSKIKPLIIKSFRTSSPEVTPYLMNGRDFPIKLGPLSSLEIQLVFLPENLGLFECVFYIMINDVIYVGTMNAFVIPNQFDLTPLYIADVGIGQKVVQELEITNPTHQLLVIEEIYSTDFYAQLQWPSGEMIPQQFDSYGNGIPTREPISNSEFLKIQPFTRNHICNIVFQVNQSHDFYSEIMIRTSQNDLIRIPMYFHVNSDIMRFEPSIIDFGVVPNNFDVIKVQVRGTNKGLEPIRIHELYVPISDERIDFIFLEARMLEKGPQVEVNQEVFFGYCLLIPNSPGMILQKIILNATGILTNTSYKIELPIVGNVLKNNFALQGGIEQQQLTNFRDFVPPMVTFDISEYIMNQPLSRMLFVIPQFRPVILTAPLIIKNTFDRPISIKGIINNNPEFKVDLLPGINHDILYREIILFPNETIKFAQIELLTTSLKITQGIKYISIQVNNTLIPAAIQIYDKHLTCVWEEQQKSRYLQCAHGYDMNFGYVPTSEPKIKKLNITNLNPHNITLENLVKSQIDDLIVYVDKYVDRYGRQLLIPNPLQEDKECKINFMTQKRTKKIINFTIQPYQTLQIIFQVSGREAKKKSSKIEFQIRKRETSDFSFNYSYQVLEGNLTLVPQVIRFQSSYIGTLQSKPIIARSTFDVPILISQISSSDIRIFPQFSQQNTNIIMPRNKTEIGHVGFDANRYHTNMLFQNFENSIGLNNPHANTFDNAMEQQLLQLITGGVAKPNNGQFTMILNQGQQIQFNQQNHQHQQGQYWQNHKQIININDLILYKERQKTWDDLGQMGKTEINAVVTIETNVFQNISVQVKAHLSKPSIILDEVVDFDIVQIGTISMKNIKIVNPSEEPLIISLFLANQPLNKANELNQKATINQTNDWSDQFLNLKTKINKNSYLNHYCNQKQKYYTGQDNFTSTFYEKSNHSEIYVSGKVNSFEICSDLQKILNDQHLSEKTKKALIQNVETFFHLSFDEYSQLFANNNLMNFNKNIMQLNKDLIKKQQNGLEINDNNFKDLLKNLSQNGNPNKEGQQNQQQPIIGPNFELDSLANQINKASSSRFIDQYTVNMLRINERANTKGFFENLKNLFSGASFKMDNQTRNNTKNNSAYVYHQLFMSEMKQQKRFRLKNYILNEIIINNDTSKFQNEYVDMNTQKTLTISNQSFYLNPKIFGMQFKIDPRSNFTFREAIIFQPQSLQNELLSMNLIVKNNLTHLYQVELTGKSGTGLIEFIQPDDSSNYNYYKNQELYKDEYKQYLRNENLTDNFKIENARQSILKYIYGDFYEGTEKGERSYKAQKDLEKYLYFNIAAEDMIVIQDFYRENQESDYQSITDMLTDKYSNIKLNSHHKRVFIAQNVGNLPINIDSISIDGKGCTAYGIQILNCHSFSLKPGQTHQITISYQTDYTIGKLKKPIILESKYFVQEFILLIQLPLPLLPLANQISPMTPYEETASAIMKLLIFCSGVLALLYVSRDILGHFQFKHDQLKQEKLDNHLQQAMYFKLNQPIKHKEIPILRDMLAHEQIFQVYQTAQEKFDNPNQLLLKEITNLYSKKNLVCLEAQKQALEAENYRRVSYRQQNLTINKYLERKDKEEVNRPAQHESNMQFQQTVGNRHQDSTKQQQIQQQQLNQVQSKEIDQQNRAKQSLPQPVSVVIQKEMSKQPSYSEEKISIQQQQKKEVQELKVTKQDDQALVQPQKEKLSPLDIQTQTQIQPQPQLSQKQDSTQEQSVAQSNTTNINSQTQPQKVVRIMNKKQQRQTAQRIKEQQELEERFRQAEKRKEEQRLEELKRKEQEIIKAKELARRAEEELKKMKEQEEYIQAQKALQLRKDTWEDQAPQSSNQSIQYERENSLNLSQINEEKQISGNKKQDQEFKKDLDYIGDLNEQNQSFISGDQDQLKTQEKILDSSQIEIKQNKEKTIELSHSNIEDSNSGPAQETKSENIQQQKILIQRKEESLIQKQLSKNSQDQETDSQPKSRDISSNYEDSFQHRYQNQQLNDQGQTGFQKRGQNSYAQNVRSYQNQNQLASYKPRSGYQQNTYNQGTYVTKTQYQNYSSTGRGQASQSSAIGQASSNRRVFINNQRGHYQSTSYSRGRGRGFKRGSYNDYDDEEYEYQQNNYTQQQQYYRKQFAKEDYDEDSYEYQNESQYRQRFQRKQNFTSQDENEDSASPDDKQKQEEVNKSQEIDKIVLQSNSKYQKNDNLILISDQDKVQNIKDDEDSLDKDEEEKSFVLKQSEENIKKGQLSKDDLMPFFESQKKTEEVLLSSRRNSIRGSVASPPQQQIGQSIFSFNPLNIFTQQSSSKQSHKKRESSPEYELTVNQLIDDDDDYDQYLSKKQQQKQTQQNQQNQQANRLQSQNSFGNQNQSTDFYNTFKSASSLFSKPLFGNTFQKQQDARLNQQNEGLSSSFINQNNDNSRSFIEKEEPPEAEDDYGSLFSGSLFGDHGPFSSYRRNQASVEEANTALTRDTHQRFTIPVNHLTKLDDQFFPPPGLAPVQGNSGASVINQNYYNNSYFQQQPSSAGYGYHYPQQPQFNQQTVFGNAFGMNLRQNFNISPGGQAHMQQDPRYYEAQQRAQGINANWNVNSFKEPSEKDLNNSMNDSTQK